MFLIGNRKMRSTNDSKSGGSDAPPKGTYAEDVGYIDAIIEEEGSDAFFIGIRNGQVPLNPITYFDNDLVTEIEDPSPEYGEQIIHNHETTLEVKPANSYVVKCGKEEYDLTARTAVALTLNPLEEDTPDPSNPET